jgi:hypothetical protein
MEALLTVCENFIVHVRRFATLLADSGLPRNDAR